MDGWDCHVDHDFYVRAYFNTFKSKRFLVKRYTTHNKNTRLFKILGTPYVVRIFRSRGLTTSYTHSVPEHYLEYKSDTSTEEIVRTALTQNNFLLVSDSIDADTLF
mgnify:CR=1 FL=1